MKFKLIIILGIFNHYCFGQIIVNDSSIIRKFRIYRIFKVIESNDSIGNKNLAIPYKYYFNKNGTLKKFECSSFTCGFYTDVKKNFSIFKYFYNDNGQLVLIKYIDPIKRERYEFQYFDTTTTIETRYEIHKIGLFKTSKIDYFTRESILDTMGREILIISNYLLSGQKDTVEYKYNSYGQKSSVTRTNPIKDTTYYEYEYTSDNRVIKIFEIQPPNQRELWKEFIYRNNGLIEREVEYFLDISTSYNYKYRYD